MTARRRLISLLAVAGLYVAVVGGVAQGGSDHPSGTEVACEPSWFVPSLTFTIERGFVMISATYAHVWEGSPCRIPQSKPFRYRLRAVGRDGYLVSVLHGAFGGDQPPGGSTGGGSRAKIKTWCAHQPVSVTLTGARPNGAHTGAGYRLVLPGIRLRCR